MKPSNRFEDLTALVERLRKECPWDRRQTHDSIKDNLIEEAYEAVDAIDQGKTDELKKELGDVLLHVLFHSRMAEETSAFSIEDVIYSISEKLINLHPHVFGNEVVNDEKEVAENWESIKLREGKNSILDGLPRHLPALIRAYRMQEKAGNVGFDWSRWDLAWEKLDEELNEWKEAIHTQNEKGKRDEFGDLLFSMVNVGRLLDLNAEDSLRRTNSKFENRFRFIEDQLRKQDRDIIDSTLEEMDELWNKAKQSS